MQESKTYCASYLTKFSIDLQSFQLIWMEFDILLRLDVINDIFILINPFNLLFKLFLF